jgi:hypothetical protein
MRDLLEDLGEARFTTFCIASQKIDKRHSEAIIPLEALEEELIDAVVRSLRDDDLRVRD